MSEVGVFQTDYSKSNMGHELREAARAGLTEKVLEILNYSAELIDDRDITNRVKMWNGGTNGSTALILACYFGHIDTAIALLNKGADIGATDNIGRTALHFACDRGYEEIVFLLLDRGAVLNQKDKFGRTPLQYACNYTGNTAIVAKLLALGADSRVITDVPPEITFSICQVLALFNDQDGETPLHYASNYGYLEIVKLLLSYGINVNAQDKFGFTALHYASSNGNDAMVSILLAYNPDRNLRNKEGNTPLDIAIEYKHLSVIALLG